MIVAKKHQYYPFCGECTLDRTPSSRAGTAPGNATWYEVIDDPDPLGGFRRGARFPLSHVQATLRAHAFTPGTIIKGPGTDEVPGILYRVVNREHYKVQELVRLSVLDAPERVSDGR